MNYALIFAGGTGQRMNSKSLPKQFLNVHGKPIIIHTLLHFENCDAIDGIVVVCYEPFLEKLRQLTEDYNIKKTIDIVPGGESGQLSIFNGLKRLSDIAKDDDIVLIHDGVRPLIDGDLIFGNIECVKRNGNAITVSRAVETVVLVEDGNVDKIEDRTKCFHAKAPQSFYFSDIYDAHLKAAKAGKFDFVDSAMLMTYYGSRMFTVACSGDNIKITTQIGRAHV